MGLSGSGKSTAAPIAAGLLGCAWCDIDGEVERAHGVSIADFFATRGEDAFRVAEQAAMQHALDAAPQVVAAGGGWASRPGNLASAQPRACVIYLSITPAEAAARLAGRTDRPLLAEGGLEERLTAQLSEREKWYRLADIELPAGGVSPDTLAHGIAEAARLYARW